MSRFYAELNDNNIVFSIAELSNEVNKDTMIELPTYHFLLIGSKYEDGTFKKIALNNQWTTINTLINIPITYKKFDLELGEYITDTSIYKDVNVYVNGELIGTETILNGQGIIEFESAEIGTYKITVENTSCEVIVE